ncbi:MAG: hypothetical protein KY476_10005 [Planctomycetes bacterium]|nr:hypothetical protein [Planctomycetota bacterium]
MKVDSRLVLKCLMWFVCAFHVIVGAGLNLFEGMAPLMAEMYGAKVDWTPEFRYLLKPLGAFMFVLGITAAAAAREPQRYRIVIYAFASLFLIRSLQRLVFAEEVQQTFAIATGRNIGNMLFFAALAAALIVVERLAQQNSADRGAGG